MTKITDDVLDWLVHNAYAVKDGGFWLMRDFPEAATPEMLHIPMTSRSWNEIRPRIGRRHRKVSA